MAFISIESIFLQSYMFRMELMIVLKMPKQLYSCIVATSTLRQKEDYKNPSASCMRQVAGSTGKFPATLNPCTLSHPMHPLLYMTTYTRNHVLIVQIFFNDKVLTKVNK